ncbi:hypothetical protein [Rhizobium lusitanum]|nr:hypothetical protein [Rhizobium lusitanum]
MRIWSASASSALATVSSEMASMFLAMSSTTRSTLVMCGLARR